MLPSTRPLRACVVAVLEKAPGDGVAAEREAVRTRVDEEGAAAGRVEGLEDVARDGQLVDVVRHGVGREDADPVVAVGAGRRSGRRGCGCP